MNRLLSDASMCNTSAVYAQYKSKISELVAYIEVYEHDLPQDVMAEIAELFQIIALFETEMRSEEDEALFRGALYDASISVTQSMYKHAIFLFIKKIQEYKKIFKKYLYKGIVVGDEKFFIVSKRNEKSIKKIFIHKIKLLYKRNKIQALKELPFKKKIRYLLGYFKIYLIPAFLFLGYEPYLPQSVLCIENIDDEDLADVYVSAKELLRLYEDVAADVVSNGAKRAIIESVFLAITSWLIPVVLLVPGLIELLG